VINFLVNVVLSLPLVGAFAIFALGIVVIYRASRVLNLAHGAIAMFPAYVVYSLDKAGLPIGVSLLVGIASGALLGVVVERVFIRGLRGTSETAQTVGTVAVLALLIALASRIWGTAPLRAPALVPDGHFTLHAAILRYGDIALFVSALVLSAAMLALFQYTDMGLAMRAAAQNRRAAALMGVDPDRTTSLAWAIGGGLAAVAGIQLAAVTNLQPTVLSLLVLPAFVAALLGGLESLTGALLGSAAVGLVFGLVPSLTSVPGLKTFAAQPGAPQLALALVAFLVMAFRGQRLTTAGRNDGALSSGGSGRVGRIHDLPRIVQVVAIIALLGWVWIPGVPYSVLTNTYEAGIYTLVALSLVLLTGWVGQISLGHAAFVGIGAFTTGLLVRHLNVPFPLNLPLAAVIAGGLAALLGLVALRVRGLYLAVATLIFSWMADSFLFASAHVVGPGGSSTIQSTDIGPAGGLPYFDFTDPRILYGFALSVVICAIYAVINIRDSKTGRAFRAIRGSEVAAASLGVSVTRFKVLAFAVSGMLAGAAGNLQIIGQRTVVPAQFSFTVSLFFLSIVVVGGLTSIPGAVVAALLFAALRELFFRVEALNGYLDLVSAALLVGALLVQSPALRVQLSRLRGHLPDLHLADRVNAAMEPLRLGQRAPKPVEENAEPDTAEETEAAPVAEVAEPIRPELAPGTPVLEGDHITVRFGGLTAVSDASIRVEAGQIVGLIGPNGAGKTTLFNALSGLNQPTEGTVRLYGQDVSQVPVHERARMGLGRTFQVLQLFGDLTVRDNLLVATHVANDTGIMAHVLATEGSIRAERSARQRVDDVIKQFGIEDVADRPAAGLPFGLLRMVELARAVVTEAPLIMLDEPASGLDNNETDKLAELLLGLRRDLGVAMLLIEHDVHMVTRVSDYMYVLAQGQLLAQGRPEEVQRDPAVVAAYLGESVDDEAPAAPVGV
jgi:ABC-type branched-subunit amino acid transport system ATPase component/branched-subunit amino acid ABC-type transport system permease component